VPRRDSIKENDVVMAPVGPSGVAIAIILPVGQNKGHGDLISPAV
jgi:hypothetical protein